MPVKSVCAWGSGRIAGIKSNRTPHSGGSLCSAGSVCIHVLLSVRSSRSVSLCLLCAAECIQHCFLYVGWPCQMPWPQKPLLLNQTRGPRGQSGTPPPMPSRTETSLERVIGRYEWMWQEERCKRGWKSSQRKQRLSPHRISTRWKRHSSLYGPLKYA